MSHQSRGPNGGPSAVRGVPNLPRGKDGVVDLHLLKNREKYQHRFALCVSIPVSGEAIALAKLNNDKVMAIDAEIKARIANGNITEVEAMGILQFRVAMEVGNAPPFGQLDINTGIQEGPGCLKCGVHWLDPDRGVGALCSVSDDDGVLNPLTPAPGLSGNIEHHKNVTEPVPVAVADPFAGSEGPATGEPRPDNIRQLHHDEGAEADRAARREVQSAVDDEDGPSVG